MTKEERIKFLKDFAKSNEWRKIREAILVRLDAPYWMIDEDGNYLHRIEQNRSYCQLIKDAKLGQGCCEEALNKGLEQMREKKGPLTTRCRAGFLGFVSPLISEDKIIGAIGGCQIVDSELSPEAYRETAEELGLNYDKLISCLDGREAIPGKLLEIEIDLIHLLCQSSIEVVIQEGRVREREFLMDNLVRFYRLLEANKNLFLEVDPDKLYQLIVDIISRSINCEVCSLMLFDPKTNLLTIKAAVGLSDEVMKKTKVKPGEGVAGWVALHGESLLVKDINQDARFRPSSFGRYYTKSFVSVPIKIDRETIGVLNINNESSRRIFSEGDLKILNIITENAAVVIGSSMSYEHKKAEDWAAIYTLEERQEALRLQVEKMKVEAQRLRAKVKEAEKWKKEAKSAETKASKSDTLRQEADQLRKEALAAKEVAERERLRTEVAKLRIEAEDLEHKKEAEALRQQVEGLKSQVEDLQSEENKLKAEIKEAEELLVYAEKSGELEEETEKLRKQIEQMKQEGDELKRQIKDVERLRARAEEAEKLRAQTKELTTLYEISKEVISIPNPEEIPPWTLGKIQPLLNYDLCAHLLLEEGHLLGEIKPLKPVTETFIEGFKNQMAENWKALLKEKEEGSLELELDLDPKMVRKRGGAEELELQFTPLIDRNAPAGIIYVGYLPGNGTVDLTKRVLPIVGAHASVALEKLRIYLETKDLVDKDELTGLYNFRYFGKYFMDTFKISTRHKRPFGLLMIDFDHLKKFNDTFGHEEGNRLIKTIAELIKGNTRDEDVLARFGGDEFVVILPETPGRRVKEVADRILSTIRSHKHVVQDKPHKITASIGLASFPELKAKSAKDFFMRADEALYQAKESGRNQVYVYKAK